MPVLVQVLDINHVSKNKNKNNIINWINKLCYTVKPV
jgi:hypothetical protein